MYKLIWLVLAVAATAQDRVVVRPQQSDEILVNPGMGIQTFQRFNGEALNEGTRWSEVGPETAGSRAAVKPDFPDTSVAYLRWFWSQLEPEPGKYRWEIIDTALEEARKHRQTLMIRMMPYDNRHPMPEWYQKSGARRANKPEDEDGKIWSPDADDPLYARHWNALVRTAGARYDGHPWLDSVDISTVGYWGEGWGPHLPSWEAQKAYIDVYFEVFKRTPLLMNFDEPNALKYGTERGAGWRLDCWGDLGGRRPGSIMHMLDMYPQQIARTGIQDVWQRSTVSLETCGTPAGWKQSWKYTDAQVDYNIEQALRWHASTINIKSTAIPPEWKARFDEFQKKLGYRFALRKLEYPAEVKAGTMMTVNMWWLNAGVAPVYSEYRLELALGKTRIAVPVDVRRWLPGDAVFDGPLYVPDTLAPGEYPVRVALIDPRTDEPAIKLAIAGRAADGWYDLGRIRVR